MIRPRTLLLAATVASVCLVALASARDKKPIGPLGACTITVYGVPPSCTFITKKACDTATAAVKGVSTWVEGARCPDPG